MGNLVLNFLREQGILVVLGLMLVGGLWNQILASRRYRRLRAGIQSLAALQGAGAGTTGAQSGGLQSGSQRQGDEQPSRRGRKWRRGMVEERQLDSMRLEPSALEKERRESVCPESGQVHTGNAEMGQNPELDSQLLYLKQSLDRIAAGRDQKLEEETRERRKLTPEQEAVIADILREYLS